MPRPVRIKKEDVLNVAYDIVREKGIQFVNARAIAEKLNSSVQPIFSQFTNMDELKKELTEKILETYRKYIKSNTDCKNAYGQMEKNYIRFAKEEPKLFNMLFMNQTDFTPDNFACHDSSFAEISKSAKESTKLSDEEVKQFHLKMWIFVHGIATLVANDTCKFTDEQIDNLLLTEYKALMQLEKMKNGGNKNEI